MNISLENDPLIDEISILVGMNSMSLFSRPKENNSLSAIQSAIEEVEQLLNELSK